LSPTVLSLRELRAQGWRVAVCERWIARLGIKQDVWGFADLLCVHPKARRFLLVQTTTISHLAARIAKAKAKDELRDWLTAGGFFECHGWTKIAGSWRCKRVAVQLGDLGALAEVVTERPPRRRRKDRFQAPLLLFAAAE
jgi:hypothetical protein